MARSLYSVDEVATMIARGDTLILAGPASALAALPRGAWIGGTIPYFMSAEAGGVEDRHRILVTPLPDGATIAWQGLLDADALPAFPANGPANGYTMVLLPFGSEVHRLYATDCMNWPGLFDRPVAGWVTGSALERVGVDVPLVFDGATSTGAQARACVMHVALAEPAYATIDIVNLFEPGDGDVITFEASGLDAKAAMVNGRSVAFADYLAAHAIDTRLPLVANYNGAMVNVAIAKVDDARSTVTFFAPVFSGITYRFARPVGNYPAAFAARVDPHAKAPAFSCNCVLNYSYADLAGQRTGGIVGPMSFGEIAYVLLTQTLVTLTIEG